MDTNEKNISAQEHIDMLAQRLEALTPDTIQPVTAIEATRLAVKILEMVCHAPDGPEYTSGVLSFTPEVFGQVMMEHLNLGNDLEWKVFFLKAATHMGPDWLESMRKAAAFMIKVEGFN